MGLSMMTRSVGLGRGPLKAPEASDVRRRSVSKPTTQHFFPPGALSLPSGPCAGCRGLTAGLTYQLELLRVFKMLPSCNEEHSRVDA